jgi:hypothetical protein
VYPFRKNSVRIKQLQHKPVKLILAPKQEHVPTDANIIYDYLEQVDAWLSKDL